MAVSGAGSSTVPSLPPPCPKFPPEYLALYGKRREMAKVVMLEREIGFLEEELKSVERLQPASQCCKEVAEFVVANSDPLLPTYRENRRSCRFWRWLCKSSCFSCSWICCNGCSLQLELPRCCDCNLCICPSSICCSLPKWQCCCFPRSRCLKKSSCCRSFKCQCPSCPDCNLCICPTSICCSLPEWQCCCFPRSHCLKKSSCCRRFKCQCPSCPDCSCITWKCSCPRRPKVQHCCNCTKKCCNPCCLCY